MTRLGAIARADDGGLGNQTREFVEHVRPDVVVCVAMGDAARGREDVARVAAAMDGTGSLIVNHGPTLDDAVIAAALEQCDTLYTVEGPYHPDLRSWCDARGVDLVIHANPELFKPLYRPHRLLLPTSWRSEQHPEGEVLPFPVCTDRFTAVERTPHPWFAHVAGPAMLDRQGTQILLDALPYVRHDCTVRIRHAGNAAQERRGRVQVEWLAPSADYWDAIEPRSWALIQPRRYGGLSLCVQEAAALGLPTIALDREPESTFYASTTIRVPVLEEQPHPMAGGQIGVAETHPQLLAETIDAFITAVQDDTPLPVDPAGWATAHSWTVLAPVYDRYLGRDAATRPSDPVDRSSTLDGYNPSTGHQHGCRSHRGQSCDLDCARSLYVLLSGSETT